jgi:hypothetical protein
MRRRRQRPEGRSRRVDLVVDVFVFRVFFLVVVRLRCDGQRFGRRRHRHH